MPLHNQRSSLGILYLNFNQDARCITIADAKGIKIYSIDTHKVCYAAELGAVSICEQLFCTSLLGWVGAGEQPVLTPRKLTLMNSTTQSVIQELSFPTSVLALQINRKRLVVVLERRVYVHALESLELLETLDTAPNAKGVCALTVCAKPCLLALPSSAASGKLRIHDLLAGGGGSVLSELAAHNLNVVALAWNHDGTLLASASAKGTVLRVHRMPAAAKQTYSFRRGTRPAAIHSLAFSPASVRPALLCAASGRGTVHLYRLEEHERSPAVVAASGILATVIPFGQSVGDSMDLPRCFATLRLPCQAVPAICAIHAASRRSSGDSEDASECSAGDTKEVAVLVATAEGILYEYAVRNLRAPHGPACALEQESFLLRADS
ncbi:hypothetical protein WJX81_008372 [Elliptochloris bilobata]|uniref:Uncharacterized protein n=1 Tax=Elliptochloris bilobata TaxID=381761 RepID=A0AAW1RJR7_9CHLO